MSDIEAMIVAGREKAGISVEQQEALFALARSAAERADRMIASFSGTDQAESEAYYGEGRVYSAVAMGTPIEEALATEDKRWRSYAAEQSKKVASYPKMKHGPMRGHSVISHRWVSPEKFTGMMSHIRFMVNKVAPPPAPRTALELIEAYVPLAAP